MDFEEGQLINSQYEIQEFVGKGSFGYVYKALDKKNNRIVAIKTEDIDEEDYLYEEFKLYNKIMNHKSIPNVYYYGQHNNKNILVMSYLGNNLGTLFKYCDKKFSIKTVCMLVIQIIDILEHIHSFGIIHKDIKPENILIGHHTNKNNIYLIDFGLSNKYLIDKITHIPWDDNKQFSGTYRYSSIRNHTGSEQSRRDDLESLGYILIYFLKGKLPWENLKPKESEERVIQIFNKKKNITCEKLCNKLPNIIYEYIKTTRLLRFKEKPNYSKIKQIFIKYLVDNKLEFDYKYDWILKANKEKGNIQIN
tara:strand:+ start:936 stop:1856 length:921 start_codon:yes stop_codon:yes gene_type:complete